MKDEGNTDLERFKTDTARDFELSQEQRDRANEDMRFCNVDGGMWEDWLSTTHGDTADRVRMELDVTSDYVQRFVGQWKLNRTNALFEAGDSDTSEDDVDILNGVYRGDFRDNDGEIAQDTAVEEMAECGCGAFKMVAQFEDDEDPENENQDIHFQPIYNAFNHVIWEANAKRADKADAKHCTVLSSYTPDAFKAEYPDLEPVSAYAPQTRASFNWYTPELIYVAERYEVKQRKVTVFVYRNVELNKLRTFEQEQLDKVKEEIEQDGWEFVRERRIVRQIVEKSIFTGQEFIEEPKRIAGKYIPIIPIYGFRKFVDGSEHYRGLVRKLKDANRLINTNISRMAEAGASSGDTLPILTRKQVEGLEEIWSNKTDKAYLLINDLEDGNGNPIASGPLGYDQPNQVDPNTIASTEIISNFVQRATGNAPQDQVDPDASGVAIGKLEKRENLSTTTPSDNIKAAIKHSGKVWLAMASESYTGQREKNTVSLEGKSSLQQLGKTVIDEQTGIPQEHNPLQGKFKADVTVGPQYETEREATLESVERFMGVIGEGSPFFAPLVSMWVQNAGGTGLEPLKEFNRKQMLLSGLVKPETEEEEQMIAQAGQQQSPQDELTKAAAQQQLAEAENLKASSIQKLADAKKKQAEAVQLTENIKDTFIERRLSMLSGDARTGG